MIMIIDKPRNELLKASTQALINFCRYSLVEGPEAKDEGVSTIVPEASPN
jgi:hypothetical protein